MYWALVESPTIVQEVSTRLRARRASPCSGQEAQQRSQLVCGYYTVRGVAPPQYTATEKLIMRENNTAPGVKAPDRVPEGTADPPGTNDDVSLNPQGREESDSSNQRDRILNCRHHTNVATMNVRTIRTDSKRSELANNCNKHKIAILGVVDHKIVHREEDIKYQPCENYMLITSSAWRKSNNSASGGVGLMISKSAEKALSQVIPWNERVLIAHFKAKGHPTLTVIVHYAPIEGSDEAEDHYESLLAATHSIPKHNVLLVIGDFNAHLGEDKVKCSYHKNTNSNGELLNDLSSEANLLITNTHFQKKKEKLWTYISDMSDAKTQVDYILINRKWKNSVKNCEAYSSFSSIGSDHRVVTAKLKLSLRTSKTPPREMWDWTALRNKTTNDKYTIEVKNRFSVLCTDEESATERYDHFIEANKVVASEILPQRKRTKKKCTSTDARVQSARELVQTAFDVYATEASNANQDKLQKAKAKLQEAYDAVTEDELSEMVTHVEMSDECRNHGESWKLINSITGRKNTKTGILKGQSKEDRLQKWMQFFSKLLGSEPATEGDPNESIPTVIENANITTGPFSKEEYTAVKSSLTLGKAAGPDGIPPDVFKLCNFDDLILSFANGLFEDEKPEQWSTGNLIPIPKTGDLSEYCNYRGIMLSSVAAKITNRMILNRIQLKIDEHLRPNQNGFRPGRSTTAHTLALRRLIEGVKRNNLKAIITFVDFRKAFDSIHRGKMMNILKAYGVPAELVKVINKLYENTKARVVTPDGETDLFDIVAGVLQGDTLAPYLFTIVLDYTMRQAVGDSEEKLGFELERRKSSRHPAVTISDLDFADDIALLSENNEQAQQLLQNLEEESAKVGLHLNGKKTKVMAYNQETPIDITTRSGERLEVVDNFKYLGSWMESSEKDFEIRKALAWSSCHKLKKIWNSSLSRTIKVRLFIATVESVLLYGSEAWTITKALEKRINGCYTRMLRMILNISWKQKLTNDQLYQELPRVANKIADRRMKLAGHCIRHPELSASSLVLWQPTKGAANRGKPALTYIDNLYRDLDVEKVDEIRSAMNNRGQWRDLSRLVRVGTRTK